MSDAINYTSALSPHDYATTLKSFSDKMLEEQAQNNFWCWKHVQQTEIDYKARYQACVTLQLQRSHERQHTKL